MVQDLNLWNGFQVLGFSKIIRIRRLTEFINRLNLPGEIKSVVLIQKILLFLFIYFHVLSCLWSWTTKISEFKYELWKDFYPDGRSFNMSLQWYPPVYSMNYLDSKYYEFDHFKDYSFNFYYAIMIYGFGDLLPSDKIQNLVSGTCLICSVMVTNFYVGEIAGLVGAA